MSAFLPFGSTHEKPWFRIGGLDVSTTIAAVLVVAVSWILWIVDPTSWSLLAMHAPSVADGEVWRLFTWPLANSIDIWGVLNLLFFWMFGTELENQVGRVKMAKLLGGIWLVLTAVSLAIGLTLGGAVLAGIGMVQFLVLLLWIAEYPRRPFFFGIPAWVVGAVLVGVQVAGMMAQRQVGALLSLLLSLALVAMWARRLGLLSDFAWIPGRPGKPKPPRPSKQQRDAATAQQQRISDQARIDALLDEMNAKGGIDGLSAAQRRELTKLQSRRR